MCDIWNFLKKSIPEFTLPEPPADPGAGDSNASAAAAVRFPRVLFFGSRYDDDASDLMTVTSQTSDL